MIMAIMFIYPGKGSAGLEFGLYWRCIISVRYPGSNMWILGASKSRVMSFMSGQVRRE